MSKCTAFHREVPPEESMRDYGHVVSGLPEKGFEVLNNASNASKELYNKYFQKPEQIAAMNKAYDKVYQEISKMDGTQAERYNEYKFIADDYINLASMDKARTKALDDVIVKGDIEAKAYSDAELQSFGLDAEQIAAYKGIRTALDTINIDRAKEYYKKGLYDDVAGIGVLSPKDKKLLFDNLKFMHSPTDSIPDLLIGNVSLKKRLTSIKEHGNYIDGYMPRVRKGNYATRFSMHNPETDKVETIFYAEHGFIPKAERQAHLNKALDEILAQPEYKNMTREQLMAAMEPHEMGRRNDFHDEEYDRQSDAMDFSAFEKVRRAAGDTEEMIHEQKQDMIQEGMVGFSQHSRKRKGIAGWERDNVTDVLAGHLSMAAKTIAKLRHTGEVLKKIEAIDTKENPGVKALAKDLYKSDSMSDRSSDVANTLGQARQVTFHMAMGLQLKTAATNLFGARINVMTHAVRAGYKKGAGIGEGLSAMKLGKYVFAGDGASMDIYKAFAKAKRENSKVRMEDVIDSVDFGSLGLKDQKAFKAGLKEVIKQGKVGGVMTKEFSGGATPIQGRAAKLSAFLFEKAEVHNRLSAYITGYKMHSDGVVKNTGHRTELLKDAHAYAKQFITDVNHDYGDINRSGYENIALGTRHGSEMKELGRLAGVFQSYQLNQMGMLYSLLKEGNHPALATYVLGMGAIGGVGAMPIISHAIKLQEAITGENELDDWKAQSAMLPQVLSSGVGSLLGFDMSGSYQFEIPFVESGTFALNKFNSGKGIENLANGDVYKAIYTGALTPAFVRNAAKALDLHDRGYTDKSGKQILVDGKPLTLTKAEAFAYGLGGFRPNKLSIASTRKFIASKINNRVNDERRRITNLYSAGKLKGSDIKAFNHIIKEVNKKYNIGAHYLNLSNTTHYSGAKLATVR